MHGYYWDRLRLKKKLEEFTGGQFLMETKEGLVFRGEMEKWFIPDMSQRRIFIYFSWLCERHFRLDELFRPVTKWTLLESPARSHCLNVEFTTYYFQRKRDGKDGKEPREERIKMWTPLGEVCRFFKGNDPSNLKQQEPGDEFLPCYKPKPDSGPED